MKRPLIPKLQEKKTSTDKLKQADWKFAGEPTTSQTKMETKQRLKRH